MRFKIAYIALAVVCVLVAPALSMPQDSGAAKHDGCRFAANNLTEAQMNNMTLGELEKMRLQESANSGMNDSCKLKHNQSANGPCGHDAPCVGDDGAMRFGGQRSDESPLLLLMDDITADKLSNMTLNQIKALKQEKTDELRNMTLGQIKALEQKKTQEQNNMTSGDLESELQEQQEVAHIMGFVQIAGPDGLIDHGSQPCMDAKSGHGQGRMAGNRR